MTSQRLCYTFLCEGAKSVTEISEKFPKNFCKKGLVQYYPDLFTKNKNVYFQADLPVNELGVHLEQPTLR